MKRQREINLQGLQSVSVGELLSDLHNTISAESDKDKPAIGLIFLHASWNRCDDGTAVADFLAGIGTLLSKEVTFTIGACAVDESEESLDLFIGDNQDGGASKRKTPVPPPTLPAIAIVSQASSTAPTRMEYISEIPSSNLLRSVGSSEMTKDLLSQHVPSVAVQINKVLALDSAASSALRIFVAGDRSSVGKSSACLGLLGNLLQMGYLPSDLAYIKPATQCEAPQLVQTYCDSVGIECRPIGPLVYYKGFTRAFLAGQTSTTDQLLNDVGQAVDEICANKKVVLVDGVGFPAVGSICGTDNASVARACGYPETQHDESTNERKPIPVLLIGGVGVGGAVDAFNLNATYFDMAQVPVMGVIFNKLPLDGFYSLENCRTQITSYFAQSEYNKNLGRRPFGFVPIFPQLAEKDHTTILSVLPDYFSTFREHVDIKAILDKAMTIRTTRTNDTRLGPRPTKRSKTVVTKQTTSSDYTKQVQPLTREMIEKRATQAGAAPSA